MEENAQQNLKPQGTNFRSAQMVLVSQEVNQEMASETVRNRWVLSSFAIICKWFTRDQFCSRIGRRVNSSRGLQLLLDSGPTTILAMTLQWGCTFFRVNPWRRMRFGIQYGWSNGLPYCRVAVAHTSRWQRDCRSVHLSWWTNISNLSGHALRTTSAK